jgi:hypothetical protein
MPEYIPVHQRVFIAYGENDSARYHDGGGTFQDPGVNCCRQVISDELLRLKVTDRKLLPNRTAEQQPDATRQDAVDVVACFTNRVEIPTLSIVMDVGGLGKTLPRSLGQAFKPWRPGDNPREVIAIFVCSHRNPRHTIVDRW